MCGLLVVSIIARLQRLSATSVTTLQGVMLITSKDFCSVVHTIEIESVDRSPVARPLGDPVNILTIYAHPNPKSFCHAVLQQFTRGLADAGHSNEVVDLYAIGFDPVWRDQDAPNWMDENVPQDILVRANLKQELLDGAKGPLQRFLVKRWIGDKDARAIIRALREQRRPKDVLEQQRKVARAQALVFISPVWFVGFPAILKGWFDRVFTLGFAFGLSADGWRGDVAGRIPLLTH